MGRLPNKIKLLSGCTPCSGPALPVKAALSATFFAGSTALRHLLSIGLILRETRDRADLPPRPVDADAVALVEIQRGEGVVGQLYTGSVEVGNRRVDGRRGEKSRAAAAAAAVPQLRGFFLLVLVLVLLNNDLLLGLSSFSGFSSSRPAASRARSPRRTAPRARPRCAARASSSAGARVTDPSASSARAASRSSVRSIVAMRRATYEAYEAWTASPLSESRSDCWIPCVIAGRMQRCGGLGALL